MHNTFTGIFSLLSAGSFFKLYIYICLPFPTRNHFNLDCLDMYHTISFIPLPGSQSMTYTLFYSPLHGPHLTLLFQLPDSHFPHPLPCSTVLYSIYHHLTYDIFPYYYYYLLLLMVCVSPLGCKICERRDHARQCLGQWFKPHWSQNVQSCVCSGKHVTSY